jgi:hypothetical protein
VTVLVPLLDIGSGTSFSTPSVSGGLPYCARSIRVQRQNKSVTRLLRITVNGDWTNAGNISGDVAISSAKDPLPQFTTQAKISEGDAYVIPINIPSGVSLADFRLIWRDDWSNYPLSDIEMNLVKPDGTLDLTGAMLTDPEHVAVPNPAAGYWLVIVDGFEIPAGSDKFELRVSLDGNVVHYGLS